MAQYLIRVTRHFYAGTIHSGRTLYAGTLAAEHGYSCDVPLRPFATRAEARAAIEEMESEVYRLGHGESGRPTYALIPESGWPESIRDRVVA